MFRLILVFLTVAILGDVTEAAEIQESFIQVDQAKIFCRMLGKGKPIIVIHGGPGLTQDYLLPNMEPLATTNQVIFYDQRGCGNSTGELKAETINIATFVEDLERLRKEFKFEKIALLGHSWGGLLAMQYAIAHPDAVEKLILSNACPASQGEFCLFIDEWFKRMTPYLDELNEVKNSEGFKKGDPETMKRYYLMQFRTYCYDPKKAELLNLALTPKAAIDGLKVFEFLNESFLSKPYNLHDSLKGLTIPTLIIHGDIDPIPFATAEHIHRSMRNSQFILMKNCGHLPYVEDPEAYFKKIAEFLNK